MLDSSTPIKRIRFRGDSLQDSEQSFDNDSCDEPFIPKYGEIPRERGKFPKPAIHCSFISQTINNYTQSNFINFKI